MLIQNGYAQNLFCLLSVMANWLILKVISFLFLLCYFIQQGNIRRSVIGTHVLQGVLHYFSVYFSSIFS